MKDDLGGKGAGLAEMTNAPTAPCLLDFTIQTEACREYMRSGGVSKGSRPGRWKKRLARAGSAAGPEAGHRRESIAGERAFRARSFSMPGHDGYDSSILELNDKSVGVRWPSGATNPRVAADSYRRLIQMFGNVVLEIPQGTRLTKVLLTRKKKQKRAKLDTELDAKALKEVIEEYKKVVKKHAKRELFPPGSTRAKLVMARDAVFRLLAERTALEDLPPH